MTSNKNQLLEFPCEFPIKAMGIATHEFETEVLAIISKYFAKLSETAIRSNHSKDGKYLSITINVTAQNREQLDGVYLDLTASKLVLMAF